jgi:hypothetical protein
MGGMNHSTKAMPGMGPSGTTPQVRSPDVFEYLRDGLGLVGLWPVGGTVDEVQVGAAEQAGQVASEGGIEVVVAGAVDERDGNVQGGQLAAGDRGVLFGERREQRPGPGSDRGERVRGCRRRRRTAG